MQHSLVLQEFRKPGRRELDAFRSGDIVGPLWLPFNTATEWFYQRRFCTQRAFWHLHGVGADTSTTQARFLSMTLFESCPRFRLEGCDLDVAWVGDGCQAICGLDSDLIVLRGLTAILHLLYPSRMCVVRTVCAIRSCGSLGCFLWVAKLGRCWCRHLAIITRPRPQKRIQSRWPLLICRVDWGNARVKCHGQCPAPSSRVWLWEYDQIHIPKEFLRGMFYSIVSCWFLLYFAVKAVKHSASIRLIQKPWHVSFSCRSLYNPCGTAKRPRETYCSTDRSWKYQLADVRGTWESIPSSWCRRRDSQEVSPKNHKNFSEIVGSYFEGMNIIHKLP